MTMLPLEDLHDDVVRVGPKPGTTAADYGELLEVGERIWLLEQENEVRAISRAPRFSASRIARSSRPENDRCAQRILSTAAMAVPALWAARRKGTGAR